MNRDKIIDELCFRPEGIFLYDKLPTKFVTVGGKPDDYSIEELLLLADFTREKQEDYHARYGSARFDWADNFISIGQNRTSDSRSWERKRYSWRDGNYSAASLPEALMPFWEDSASADKVGYFVLTLSGSICEITEALAWDAPADVLGRRLTDGVEIAIARNHDRVVVAAKSLNDLADQMRMAMRHRMYSSMRLPQEERERAESAITESNDPLDLQNMWRERVLRWNEKNEMRG